MYRNSHGSSVFFGEFVDLGEFVVDDGAIVDHGTDEVVLALVKRVKKGLKILALQYDPFMYRRRLDAHASSRPRNKLTPESA